MPGMYWESLLNSPQPATAGTALASSTTLTDISPAPQLVIPAGFIPPSAGSAFRLVASGVFSNTGTPTLLLGFYLGGVAGSALAATGAITTITGATNWSWRMEAYCTVRTVGASGTIFTQGFALMPASLTQFQAAYVLPTAAPAAVTYDTTAAKAITVGAQWGTSSASNTVTCHNLYIESLGA